MKNVKVSDRNHARLKAVLVQLIEKKENPALTFDDAVEELLDLWELDYVGELRREY